MAAMNQLFAPHAHHLQLVPGVGHSARSMYTSSVGRAVVFAKP